MINKNSKIFVAGHKGLVGSAILRKLEDNGYKILAEKTIKIYEEEIPNRAPVVLDRTYEVEEDNSILAFSAASLNLCNASLSSLRSIALSFLNSLAR